MTETLTRRLLVGLGLALMVLPLALAPFEGSLGYVTLGYSGWFLTKASIFECAVLTLAWSVLHRGLTGGPVRLRKPQVV